MNNRMSSLGQPVGDTVEGWTPRPRPPRDVMEGRYCRLEPLDPANFREDGGQRDSLSGLGLPA